MAFNTSLQPPTTKTAGHRSEVVSASISARRAPIWDDANSWKNNHPASTGIHLSKQDLADIISSRRTSQASARSEANSDYEGIKKMIEEEKAHDSKWSHFVRRY